MEHHPQHTPTARLMNGKLIAASATILILTACGGGGSIETATPTIGPLLSVDVGTANEALASGKILVDDEITFNVID